MDINKADRLTLKSYFRKNLVPTESNFAELIDGLLNQKDDGIVKPTSGDPLCIAASGDAAGPQKVLNFYGSLADANAAWTLQLNPRSDQNNPATAKPGFSVSDGQGASRLYIDFTSGNIGVGTLDPNMADTTRTLALGRGAGGIYGIVQREVGPWRMSLVTEGQERLSIKDNGNVGIGTVAPNGKLEVFTGGAGAWNRFVVNTTTQWGDGDNQYVTIGAGGASGIMFNNPHVPWMASENRASIRLGRSGGVASGTWWDIGTRANNVFSILRENSVLALHITGNGDVGIGTANPGAKLHVNGSIKSPQWNVTQVFNSTQGALPKTSGAFSTGGGTLLIIASGSGWSGAAGNVGMAIQIDGVTIGMARSWTNEINSHKVFSCNPLVKKDVAAGSHTISLVALAGTITDINDWFNVTVLEFPF